ncbi:MAG: hypothetical protein ABW223_12425 [Rariglobus sp.]
MKLLPARSLRLSALLAAITLAISSVASAAATYTVDLTSPWKIGQGYSAVVTSSQSSATTVSVGGKKVQEQVQRRAASFEADAKVLEVYPHGGLRKASFKIRSLRASKDGAPETEFLPAGTEVVAESTGVTEKEFTVNGKKATDEQKAVLGMIITTDGSRHNDQILFGPKNPVAIGDQWSLNGDQLKETIGKEFGTIAVSQGTMRLDAIEGSGDSQIAVVSGKVNFKGIQPELPPGVKPTAGQFQAVLDGRIPATRTASKRVENLTATADLGGEADGPNGAKMTFAVKVEAKHSSVLTFP